AGRWARWQVRRRAQRRWAVRGAWYAEGLSGGAVVRGRERRDAQCLLLGVPLERERDQAIDERRVVQPGRAPQLGVHADRGEPGHRVDLVEPHGARRAVDEK